MNTEHEKGTFSNTPTGEIDLTYVLLKFRKKLADAGQGIFNFQRIFFKRKILIFVIIIIGVVIGLGVYFFKKPIYIATLTLTSHELSNEFCSDMIGNLEEIVDDDTPELLAKKLRISVRIAKKIEEIGFANFDEKQKKKYSDKDTVVLGLPFRIKVNAYDNQIFDTLQTALVAYFENNDFALKRREIRKKNGILMREKYKNEITQIDSLKLVVAAHLVPRGNTNGFVFGQPLDPIIIYKEGIKLFQDDLTLNANLLLIDNIQVIEEFSPKSKPDSPRLWKTTTLGGILGLLLGLIIALRLEKRKLTT